MNSNNSIRMQRDIGKMIRKYREQKKLSQAALASLTAMQSQYISEIELGQANITIKTLCKICDALDIKAVIQVFSGYPSLIKRTREKFLI